MIPDKYDFSGYVTKANIKCSDGRTILPNAFKHNDGKSVPLVYNHMHDDMEQVVGNVLLENRSDGMYGYASFNNTPKAQISKELVRHGDIKAMSIYANKLVEQNKIVQHGIIREVSLVMAGANEEAFIDNVVIRHADGDTEVDLEEAVIVWGSEIEHCYSQSDSKNITHMEGEEEETKDLNIDIKELAHQLKDLLIQEETEALEHAEGMTVQEVLDTMNEEQLSVIEMYIINRIYGDEVTKEVVSELNDSTETVGPTKTIEEVINSMTDDQRNAFYTLIESIEDEFGEEIDALNMEEENAAMQQNDEGGNEMKGNVFEGTAVGQDGAEIKHTYADIKEAMADARKYGSMKESFLQHGITDEELNTIMASELKGKALSHSVDNIGVLFPEAQAVSAMPSLVTRTPDSWVSYVIANTKHLPFSRVKSWAVDITEEEARARGYVKGSQKAEEVIKALRRTTDPTTIYKLQKLDRDDVVDITDFDVLMFLKNEMRYMLNEEIARAILVGDGRTAASPDKIADDKVRPIYTDVAPYVYHVTLDADFPIIDLVDEIIRSRRDFGGSGVPAFFGSPEVITNMLTVRSPMDQRRLYSNEAELASELRVSSIHDVPIMTNVTRTNEDGQTVELKGIMVNLRDYAVGTTTGGQISFFNDFDLNFNKYEYLIETRMSGALTIPRAAVVFEQVVTPAP